MAEGKKNGLGIAGFVVALVALVFCWVPIFNWILWAVGLILSFIAIFKQPKGFAIAGLVISLAGLVLDLILWLVVFATVGDAVSVANSGWAY